MRRAEKCGASAMVQAPAELAASLVRGRMMRSFAGFGLALAAMWTSVLAAPAGAAEGWGPVTVNRTATAEGPGICSVKGPTDGPAILAVASMGAQLMLLVASDELAQANASYPVNRLIDDHPDIHLNAVGSNGTIGIAVGG